MSPSAGVTRNTLRQQIADALRDEVLAGRLPPGREFTVKQIAEQYGVSATPVREALFDLSAQGLLASDQHRGFQVREFTVADYRAMAEARALVVEGLFRNPAEVAVRPEGLASIRRRAAEAVRAAKGGDLDVLIGYDLRFWRELGQFVLNPYIADFLTRLRVQAWVFAVHRLRRDGMDENVLWFGHEELVEAIARGDHEEVHAEMRSYYGHALAWADRLEARETEGKAEGKAEGGAEGRTDGPPGPGSATPPQSPESPGHCA
ncbi:GntR family transcriptional regulator [Streptomyces sp. MBT56]|uniref:GntR family transcriptional regulator n=1 Tax=unclassified Streptomyces TaxID=2593676 RepID=UPI00190B0313|nr:MULTISPECIES: GntR family transcriptional regulator [unclassified Streptomyces]MBK3557160.1 GntR family transcriptional regulator [Streptomyces sp. MBT56]MBK3606615.1 GntR family transcriptional regulator [Streptomyces sp. MBT54]MBK3619440.1 GntR family transcriptional regulator [Streptomyces sp. MBT98]MBK6047136.1 GntR family transcriptional regulator [Streptomyces sp. MBT55]